MVSPSLADAGVTRHRKFVTAGTTRSRRSRVEPQSGHSTTVGDHGGDELACVAHYFGGDRSGDQRLLLSMCCQSPTGNQVNDVSAACIPGKCEPHGVDGLDARVCYGVLTIAACSRSRATMPM